MADENLPHILSRKEAHVRGLKRYFTGSPCLHGHLCERWVSTNACAECLKGKTKVWRKKNRAKLRAYDKNWRSQNPELIRKYAKQNYERHKDQWRINNREWSRRNRDRVNELNRAWEARNKDKIRIWGAVKSARRRNAIGRFTVDDVAAIFKAQRGKCAYCRVSLRHGYDIDHIVALINGGTNWPNNIQLCCETCNSRKHANDPLDFARSIGRLI